MLFARLDKQKSPPTWLLRTPGLASAAGSLGTAAITARHTPLGVVNHETGLLSMPCRTTHTFLQHIIQPSFI